MGTITSEQVTVLDSSFLKPTRIRVYERLEGEQGREIFFRPQRYTPAQFAPLEVWAEITMNDVQYRCELRDLSQGGLGLQWPLPHSPVIGDEIEEVLVCFDHQIAYVGKAIVSVLHEEDHEYVVGLDLCDALIKIDALLQTRDLKVFHHKGHAPFGGHTQPWHTEGHHEYKSRVSELKLFLEDWENHFDRIEAQASWDLLRFEEDHPTRKALVELVHWDFLAPFLDQTEQIFHTIYNTSVADQKPLIAYSQRHLDGYFMKSPWMHRARTKPLGYSGDYEVMNHIYGRKMQGRTLIGQALNYATLHSPAARAVRNRKDMLKFELKKLCERQTLAQSDNEPVKILSLVSGTAQEMYELLSEIKMLHRPLTIVLFDQDAAALAFAYGRLKHLVETRWPQQVRIVYLHDSVNRLVQDSTLFKEFGLFDAIVCSGLYDHLPESLAIKLTAQLHNNTRFGGLVYLGNMVPSNPSRWIMEHHLDWYLIYRTHEELLSLSHEACPSAQCEILNEPAGVNPFIKMTRTE